MERCLIQSEWITKSSCDRPIVTFRTTHFNFCFALKPAAGGKSKDGRKPLQDLDEAERLLERAEVDLEGGHPLREGCSGPRLLSM